MHASLSKATFLDDLDHNALWEMLSEEERQKFTKMVADPTSDDLKRLFQSQELAESRKEPWWVTEEASNTTTSTIKSIPQKLLALSQFNPMLLFNIFHLRQVRSAHQIFIQLMEPVFRTRMLCEHLQFQHYHPSTTRTRRSVNKQRRSEMCYYPFHLS